MAFFETGYNPKLAGFLAKNSPKIDQNIWLDIAKFWFQLQKILHTILMIVTKYYYFMVSSYHNIKNADLIHVPILFQFFTISNTEIYTLKFCL